MAIGQAISAATEQVKTLYENPEQRPELVSTTLTKIGAEKVRPAVESGHDSLCALRPMLRMS